MTFDINKVIYRDNREKAVVGKKYYFSDSLTLLRKRVEKNDESWTRKLVSIAENSKKCEIECFVADGSNTEWQMIYPLEK